MLNVSTKSRSLPADNILKGTSMKEYAVDSVEMSLHDEPNSEVNEVWYWENILDGYEILHRKQDNVFI